MLIKPRLTAKHETFGSLVDNINEVIAEELSEKSDQVSEAPSNMRRPVLVSKKT